MQPGKVDAQQRRRRLQRPPRAARLASTSSSTATATATATSTHLGGVVAVEAHVAEVGDSRKAPPRAPLLEALEADVRERLSDLGERTAVARRLLRREARRALRLRARERVRRGDGGVRVAVGVAQLELLPLGAAKARAQLLAGRGNKSGKAVRGEG